MKWIGLQSRGAHGTNEAFLGWLRQRRPDRPFFAFLNYFDAHAPYVPPPGYEGRFGIRPKPPRDYDFLFEYYGDGREARCMKRDIQLARDCYDDCIAFLDEQLGRLLDELRAAGASRQHGGDHHLGPWRSVRRSWPLRPRLQPLPRRDRRPAGDPLPGRPGGPSGGQSGQPARPACNRGRPAGALGRLAVPGPLVGGLLAKGARASAPGITTPALSEQVDATAFQPQPGSGRRQVRFQMSLVASGHHYLRDGMGTEMLYDLRRDPFERVNLMGSSDDNQAVGVFRKMLLEVLTDNPGSIEVEKAYLEAYRQGLRALVPDNAPCSESPPVIESRSTSLVEPLDGPTTEFGRVNSIITDQRAPTPRRFDDVVIPDARSYLVRTGRGMHDQVTRSETLITAQFV